MRIRTFLGLGSILILVALSVSPADARVIPEQWVPGNHATPDSFPEDHEQSVTAPQDFSDLDEGERMERKAEKQASDRGHKLIRDVTTMLEAVIFGR